MITATATVGSSSGLHARPASVLVSTANRFTSTVQVVLGEKAPANAKSILSVISLGATHGVSVTVQADGDDAEAAVKAVVEAIEADHDEK